MTIKDFADNTGFNLSYIRNACREGKIPCELWFGCYDIPDRLVPVWRAKKKKKGSASRSSVGKFQRALDKYNRDHGTCYSYGQAVSLNILGEV